MSVAIESTSHIVSTLVPSSHRMRTLPKKFPTLFMVFESMIYQHTDSYVENYGGGFWNFYELSNGGFYMSLESDEKLKIVVESNGFEGELSADAASIVINLFVLCALAHKHSLDYLIDLYYALKDFACCHPEAAEILRAID